MKKRIFALALALCMMLSVMPTSFAGNGFLTDDSKAASQSGVLTDDSKTVPQSGVLTGASKYYRQDGILYNTGSQSGASYSLPSGTLTSGNTTTFDNSGGQIPAGEEPTGDPNGIVTSLQNTPVTVNKPAGWPASTKGLVTAKTAVKKAGTDGTYTVQLETYSTGTTVYAPADIVLVLDESSSMETSEYEYNAVDQLDTNKTYYIKDDDGNYIPVNYCETNKHTWSYSGWSTGAGWYTGEHYKFWFIVPIRLHLGYKYDPKTSTSSGTQFYSYDEIKDTTKLSALKAAAQSFVNSVFEQSVEKNADYKVSVIGYKDDATTVDSAAAEKIGLTSINTSENVAKVNAAIDALDTETKNGVELASALSIANNQLKSITDKNHQKVLVVFSCMESTTESAVNNEISAAKTIKDSGVLIFTVGMMSNADPTLDVTGTLNEEYNPDYTSQTFLVNAAMQGISSNFPNATSCRNFGANYENLSKGFYLTAANQTQIREILKKIQGQLTTSASALDKTAKVVDTVTQYFNAPAVSGVTVQTVNCASYSDATGAVTWDNSSASTLTSATISVSDGTITVSGFDFEKYCITATGKDATPEAPNGQKLVITFDITVKDGFLGGDNVPTNTYDSGVYMADSVVAHFSYPTVNVFIPEISVTAKNKNVYLSDELETEDMLREADVYIGSQQLKLGEKNFGLKPWQYAFLQEIKLTTNPATWSGTEDGTFTVTCTVTPNDGDAKVETSAAANIYVFKPEFTFKDSTIYLGNEANYQTDNLVSVVWKHGDTLSTDSSVTMNGTSPAMTWTYTPNGELTTCTDVKVDTVKLGGKKTDYRGHTKFIKGVAPTTDVQFTVHVIQPTITFKDIDIYLSDTPIYASEFAWNKGCAKNCGDIPQNTSIDTKDYFSCVYDPAAGAFTECKDVNVTVNYKDKSDAPAQDFTTYITLKNTDGTTRGTGEGQTEFTVHVYLPQIVLKSQDLWADYDCDVPLTDGMKNPIINGWVDQCDSTRTAAHTNGLPQCSAPAYQFKRNGEKITGYNAKNAQVTDYSTINVALDSVKIGANQYDVSVLPEVTPVEYKIHVNKFDLTINKTWKDGENVADGTYKQDAIFTVSGVRGPFQVVLPAGQDSIVIKGLLCGQDYTVTEDSNWTWRWNSSSEKPVLEKTDTAHTSVSVRNPHDQTDDGTNPGAHGAKSVSFTNTLKETLGELWFSFCTFVKNIFGAGRFEGRGN